MDLSMAMRKPLFLLGKDSQVESPTLLSVIPHLCSVSKPKKHIGCPELALVALCMVCRWDLG